MMNFTKNDFELVQLIVFDFDGVFTDNSVYTDQHGIETVRCWRSDGLGLSRLRDIGILTYILSTETNSVVTTRANKLKVPCRQAVDDKSIAFLQICDELGINSLNAMFVGNDINDIPAFNSAGFPIGVADSYPEVEPHIIFRTLKPGGYGAVREICDLVYWAIINKR